MLFVVAAFVAAVVWPDSIRREWHLGRVASSVAVLRPCTTVYSDRGASVSKGFHAEHWLVRQRKRVELAQMLLRILVLVVILVLAVLARAVVAVFLSEERLLL